MRVLFALDHPGRLINLGSTVTELAEAGHHVEVAFSRDKLAYALDSVDLAHANIAVHHGAPERTDDQTLVLHRIRRLADYVHYLDPSLREAIWARDGYRSVTQFPSILRWLRHREQLPRAVVTALLRVLAGLERAVPPASSIDAFVREIDPDVIVVSPLILARSDLGDYLATARAMRIPTVFPVASWDNLSSKGVISQLPDVITVWNATQRREAREFHRVPEERVVITGSLQHDQWFDRGVQSTPTEFKERHGLPADRPFVLFAGSTRQGRDPEAEVGYVRDWLAALRSSGDPLLETVPVLLRPHPLNASAWVDGGVPDLPGVFVWQRKELFPFGTTEAIDYFDGLSHCAALVAINTSAMIETAIAGRPVHTIALPEWRAMQGDLLHFRYLLPENGGFLRVAETFERHVELLAADLRDPTAALAANRAFVESFIRPLGAHRRAATALIEEIEAARARGPRPAAAGAAAVVFRTLLRAILVGHRTRGRRDRIARPLYGSAATWAARRSARSATLRRIAVSLREREDRALERLEWLGAFERDRRLPAEKWVYRRLAAERERRGGPVPSRPRPAKWVAGMARKGARPARAERRTDG